jgi:thermostable 8-oxoguanine DNA glycosylase
MKKITNIVVGVKHNGTVKEYIVVNVKWIGMKKAVFIVVIVNRYLI